MRRGGGSGLKIGGEGEYLQDMGRGVASGYGEGNGFRIGGGEWLQDRGRGVASRWGRGEGSTFKI